MSSLDCLNPQEMVVAGKKSPEIRGGEKKLTNGDHLARYQGYILE